MFYSATKNAFYAPADRAAHEDIGSWPDDAKDVPDALYAEVMTHKPAGKFVSPGEDGMPTLVDLPPLTEAEKVQAQIYAIEADITPRRMREAALTAEGKAWLAAKDAEIAALREAL